MSKTIDALRTVGKLREEQGAIRLHGHGVAVQGAMAGSPAASAEGYFSEAANARGSAPRTYAKFQNAMLMVVTVIGLVSLLLSMRTLAEIHKINISSLVTAKDIALQKKRIDTLQETINVISASQQSQIDDLKESGNLLVDAMKKGEVAMSELMAADKKLTSSVSDLQWELKSLMDKYIETNGRLKALEAKQ